MVNDSHSRNVVKSVHESKCESSGGKSKEIVEQPTKEEGWRRNLAIKSVEIWGIRTTWEDRDLEE
jgi:hypothetical protein